MSQSSRTEAPQARRWLVDGFNVLHTGVLRGRERGTWWEGEARDRLLERARGFDDPEVCLCIVFDGPRPIDDTDTEAEADGLRIVFAPDADDWLLKEVRRSEPPDSVVVVTADRKLADRARHHGAEIVSPRSFLARCTAADGTG